MQPNLNLGGKSLPGKLFVNIARFFQFVLFCSRLNWTLLSHFVFLISKLLLITTSPNGSSLAASLDVFLPLQSFWVSLQTSTKWILLSFSVSHFLTFSVTTFFMTPFGGGITEKNKAKNIYSFHYQFLLCSGSRHHFRHLFISSKKVSEQIGTRLLLVPKLTVFNLTSCPPLSLSLSFSETANFRLLITSSLPAYLPTYFYQGTYCGGEKRETDWLTDWNCIQWVEMMMMSRVSELSWKKTLNGLIDGNFLRFSLPHFRVFG